MCVTICGRFCPDEGAVAGYGNRIRAKYTAKWGVQIAGMIFQTGSRGTLEILLEKYSSAKRLFCFMIWFYQVRLTEVRIEQIVSTLAAYPTPVTQNRYCLLVGWKNIMALQSLSSIR